MARELADHHRRMLEESAITGAVIAARGYFTVEKKADVAALGFGPSLQYAPTLAIPVHGVVPGEAPWFMHRPDETPLKDGRERKYLIPAGRKMALDVHPLVHAGLGDPHSPLFVTEGPKKTDALISAGAKAVVGLAGVWNWRGSNGDGGKVLLPDWEWVALKGRRQVYIVFDSDVMLKEQVHEACSRLAGALRRMGAEVAFVYLPAAADGSKIGVDDFLCQGRTLTDVTALATGELRHLPVVEDDEVEGRSVERILSTAKPWDEAVDGAALADEVKATIRRHIVLTEYQAVAVTLWIFFSWVFDSARVCAAAICHLADARMRQVEPAHAGAVARQAIAASVKHLRRVDLPLDREARHHPRDRRGGLLHARRRAHRRDRELGPHARHGVRDPHARRGRRPGTARVLHVGTEGARRHRH
jgi:hypothetical protein